MLEAMLVAVFDHYDLPEPGWGERSTRCPVHDESNPSASVNRGKGLVHCHACGFGGTAANIVMARENVDYHAALALIAGMGVAVTTSAPPPRRTQPRRGGRWVPPRLRSTA